MKIPDFTHRTNEEEIMDDFKLEGEKLKGTLHDVDRVNRFLGGNQITIEGIEKILSRKPVPDTIRIIDVGCGNGMILRKIARYAKESNLKTELLGIDANENSIELARELAEDYSEISFKKLNVFSAAFADLKADIILCTLTLHHFSDIEIQHLIRVFIKNSNLGVVVNDLHRSPVAYYLFQLFCAAFVRNDIARKDGLTSIRRAFRKKDLRRYGSDLRVPQELSWKWAFRYQWILYKN